MTSKTLSALCKYFGQKNISMEQLCDFLCDRCDELEQENYNHGNNGRLETSRGHSDISAEDLVLVNKVSLRNLSENDIFTFKVCLCDNEIDKDNERFSEQALIDLAGMFVGKITSFSCCQRAIGARIFKTELKIDGSKKTRSGQAYCALYGHAFIIRNAMLPQMIGQIQQGNCDVSVACSVGRNTCSICGGVLGECKHKKGYAYVGKLCYANMEEVKDVYEWSYILKPTSI